MYNRMRERMRWSAAFGTLILAFSPFRPFAQTAGHTESFSTPCKNCWPGWSELARPAWGVGPSTQNKRGFIFINGFDADPMQNREHLHLMRSIEGVSEATAFFQFNNATIGGKLPLLTGGFACLREAEIITTVAAELFIVTIRDTGAAWYGAFIGDVTILDPDFIPEVETPTRQGYSSIGLLEMSDSELKLLALTVIPPVRRFAPIALTVALDESNPDLPLLRADAVMATGATYHLRSELDPERRLATGRTGIIYMVGSARPCTLLVQREVALQQFRFR